MLDIFSVNRDRMNVILAVAGYKLFFFFFVLLSIELLPALFNESVFERNPSRYPAEGGPSMASYFTTWNAANYLDIAQNGYESGSRLCAFYPLWPGFIAGLGRLFQGHYFLIGFILANVFSGIALVRFHAAVESLYDRQTAFAALVLLLATPGSMFLNFPYTEGLFLLLSVLLFEFLSKGQWRRAAVVSFLMPLTKAVGMFAVIPLVYEALRQSDKRRLGYAAVPVLGHLTYWLIMYLATGNPWEGFEAQKQFAAQPSIARIFRLDEVLVSLMTPTHVHGFLGSLIDRCFFVLFLATLPLALRLGWGWAGYVLLVGVVSAFSSQFMSFTRYFASLWPLFVVLSALLRERNAPGAFWYLVGILTVMQILLLLRHINYYWA